MQLLLQNDWKASFNEEGICEIVRWQQSSRILSKGFQSKSSLRIVIIIFFGLLLSVLPSFNGLLEFSAVS